VLESSAIEVVPAHRHADVVAELRNDAGAAPRAVVVFEVQRRVDRDEPVAWTQMLASALGRHGAEAQLVVLAFDEATARWARGPHTLGGLRLSPVVLGPRDLPHLGSVAEARAQLLLAVLIALARSAEAAGRVGRALSTEAEADILLAAEAVAELDDTVQRQRLASLVEGAAPASIRAGIL